MEVILDSSAIIAYLRNEPGASVVDAILNDPAATCSAHSINLCEVYYHFIRIADEATASQVISDLDAIGVIERNDLGRAFWQRVGRHKARGNISIPDCFCLALAQELSGQVVTSDHKEFDPIVPLGLCPIVFIR